MKGSELKKVQRIRGIKWSLKRVQREKSGLQESKVHVKIMSATVINHMLRLLYYVGAPAASLRAVRPAQLAVTVDSLHASDHDQITMSDGGGKTAAEAEEVFPRLLAERSFQSVIDLSPCTSPPVQFCGK